MKTRHQIKGLIIGLVIGVMLSSVVLVATASNGTVTLENVLIDGISIVIDNKEFTATDANGNVVKPMIYNGTTYLPVRAVATAFEKAVSWDAETKTVYLGDMDGKLKKPTVKLADLENIADHRVCLYTCKNVFDNYGSFYNEAYYSYCPYAGVSDDYKDPYEVLLDKKYSKFKATLFVVEGDTFTSDFISIIGDEKMLFKSDEMNKTSKPIEIEVDVSDINDFKILFNNNGNIRIANAGFYQ